METIATVFTGPAIVSADTAPDIVRALALSNEFGLKPILYGARDAFRLSGRLQNVPVLASMAIGSEPSVRESADGPPAAVLEDRKKTWQERAGNIAKLIGAGVKVAFSSEGDGAASYLANVRKLIGMGLDRSAALKAMTSTPAEIFGRSDWGEIKPGAQANLTVMDGDFASEKSKVRLVFVAGKKFEVKS
jgi:imidazolonepropionase-like amidohydrolase